MTEAYAYSWLLHLAVCDALACLLGLHPLSCGDHVDICLALSTHLCWRPEDGFLSLHLAATVPVTGQCLHTFLPPVHEICL